MSETYTHLFYITPNILDLVFRIGAALGREHRTSTTAAPELRRGNRIRSVQASLEIEGNTLSIEQVTAILEGKRVAGAPKEIKEVKNAISAYEKLPQWKSEREKDFLKAHEVMMEALIEEAGAYRSGTAGIKRGNEIIHIAPPAENIVFLIRQLFSWMKSTEEHPLITSSVVHYEIEFIHPFSDGNGRMGRLWQSLILYEWNPVFLQLPLESVIRDRQKDYYTALRESDEKGNATSFILFMLRAILEAAETLNTLAGNEETTQ